VGAGRPDGDQLGQLGHAASTGVGNPAPDGPVRLVAYETEHGARFPTAHDRPAAASGASAVRAVRHPQIGRRGATARRLIGTLVRRGMVGRIGFFGLAYTGMAGIGSLVVAATLTTTPVAERAQEVLKRLDGVSAAIEEIRVHPSFRSGSAAHSEAPLAVQAAPPQPAVDVGEWPKLSSVPPAPLPRLAGPGALPAAPAVIPPPPALPPARPSATPTLRSGGTLRLDPPPRPENPAPSATPPRPAATQPRPDPTQPRPSAIQPRPSATPAPRAAPVDVDPLEVITVPTVQPTAAPASPTRAAEPPRRGGQSGTGDRPESAPGHKRDEREHASKRADDEDRSKRADDEDRSKRTDDEDRSKQADDEHGHPRKSPKANRLPSAAPGEAEGRRSAAASEPRQNAGHRPDPRSEDGSRGHQTPAPTVPPVAPERSSPPKGGEEKAKEPSKQAAAPAPPDGAGEAVPTPPTKEHPPASRPPEARPPENPVHGSEKPSPTRSRDASPEPAGKASSDGKVSEAKHALAAARPAEGPPRPGDPPASSGAQPQTGSSAQPARPESREAQSAPPAAKSKGQKGQSKPKE